MTSAFIEFARRSDADAVVDFEDPEFALAIGFDALAWIEAIGELDAATLEVLAAAGCPGPDVLAEDGVGTGT